MKGMMDMIYPDALGGTLTEQEILFAAERTIELARQEAEGNDEKACQLIIAHLSMLCYDQGVDTFVTQAKKKNTSHIDPVDCMYGALLESQKKWEWVTDYCRDTLSIHLHPMGMLVFLRFSSNTENPSDDDVSLMKAIDRYAKELELKAQDELKEAPPVSVPDIDNFTGDETTLIIEFFKLMDQIGTFYHDRNRYASEEKKQLHDRIVAIHNRIVKSR